MCNDLAKAMKALDGKKRIDQVQITHHSGFPLDMIGLISMAQVLATLAMQQTDQLASVCLPVFIMRAVAGSAASGPNQEVTPLPAFTFSMDGESDPA